MTATTKPEIWVILDEDGYPVHTAGWKEACHEHINDAALHDKSAAKWVVRQVFEHSPSTPSLDALRYQVVRSRHWNDSDFCVVLNPKTAVKMGEICPSEEELDRVVDKFIESRRKT